MKRSRLAVLAALTAALLLLVFLTDSHPLLSVEYQNPPAEHNLQVRKVRNKWKVVESQDSTKTTVRAKKGEKIIWEAVGSDVYFQFMDDKLFGNYTRVLKDGHKLVLSVGNNAKTGVNHYAVFCIADLEYATGDSPPVIIVD